MPFYASFDEPVRVDSFIPAPTTKEQEFRGHVQMAASALDLIVPNWEDKVETHALDLNDVDLCVLGQVFDEFATEQTHCNCGCGGNYGYEFGSGYDYAVIKYEKELAHTSDLGVFSYNDPYLEHWIALISERQAAKVPAKSDHALVA